jgi:hypothetical protein
MRKYPMKCFSDTFCFLSLSLSLYVCICVRVFCRMYFDLYMSLFSPLVNFVLLQRMRRSRHEQTMRKREDLKNLLLENLWRMKSPP